ncbi:hypothetical protein NP493_121g03002 [Ridgeia piscesae]|uniref:Uncharacterized protein n=1 Tax=Ridgeia piscesae TaxID=27915 RepID=A0AAD9UGN5_RIDPI|nr:hypothetical protein NP493_121g03002 [Ridgeia piscesae]
MTRLLSDSSRQVTATSLGMGNVVGDLQKTYAPVVKEPDKIAYWLRSGQGVNGQATICFDGIYAVSADKGNSQRGINMVIVDGKSMFARSIYSPTQIFAQSPSPRGREAEEHKSKAYVGPGYASNTAVPGTVSAME